MVAPAPPSKRLLFDRRYGWVLDEWKEPSQEALSGGRGMFCIVPLAKEVLNKASEWVNVVANPMLCAVQRTDAVTPQVVQAAFTGELDKVAASAKECGACFVRMPPPKESTRLGTISGS